MKIKKLTVYEKSILKEMNFFYSGAVKGIPLNQDKIDIVLFGTEKEKNIYRR